MSSQSIILPSTFIATEGNSVVPTITSLDLKLEVSRNYNGKIIKTAYTKDQTIPSDSTYHIIGQLNLQMSAIIRKPNVEDYIKRNLVLYEKRTPVIPQHQLDFLISTEMKRTTKSTTNFWVSFVASASLGGDQSKTRHCKLKMFEALHPHHQFQLQFTPAERIISSTVAEEKQDSEVENRQESTLTPINGALQNKNLPVQSPQNIGNGSATSSTSTSSKRKQDFESKYNTQLKRNQPLQDRATALESSNRILSSENKSLNNKIKSAYEENLKVTEENNVLQNKISTLTSCIQQLESCYAIEVGKNLSLQKQMADLVGEASKINNYSWSA
jgi:hypothetical protein